MTTQQDALRKALEALEYHQEQTRPIQKTREAIAALREALAAQPEQPWWKQVEGVEISMDVSTGEHDAYNRIYGRATEVMTPDGGNGAYTIVAVEESRNFDTSPQPPQENKQ